MLSYSRKGAKIIRSNAQKILDEKTASSLANEWEIVMRFEIYLLVWRF